MHHPPFLAAGKQPGALEDRNVFHESGQRHRSVLRKLAHRGGAAGKTVEDRAARRVGERGEYAVKRRSARGICLIVNHTV